MSPVNRFGEDPDEPYSNPEYNDVWEDEDEEEEPPTLTVDHLLNALYELDTYDRQEFADRFKAEAPFLRVDL